MQNNYSSQLENICNYFDNLSQVAKAGFHRQGLVLSGDQAWCLGVTRHLIETFSPQNLLIVSRVPIEASASIQIDMNESTQYLGHEFSHAVLNLHDGIDPNALGAISGTISGGGILILLLPTLDNLPDFDDPEKQRMAIWPFQANDVHTRFLQRFKNILLKTRDLGLVQQDQAVPEIHAVKPTTPTLNGYLDNEYCRTEEQREAVAAIVHTAHGHRHRPLVITANRGRGKSAALGIAAAELIKHGNSHIIVTGPRLSAVTAVFEHAKQLLPDALHEKSTLHCCGSRLEFLAPDLLCLQQPKCNLLLVDEAAAIPTPMLERLLDTYSRIVFSTTTYGYEGTGRGFNIKFHRTLNQKTPGWQYLEMDLPVRWAPNDPLERFVFDALCLDAKIPDIDTTHTHDTFVKKIDRNSLVKSNVTLSSIFALLVLAHYQTQPRDLRYLLDSIGLDIFLARCGDDIVGTAIVEREGNLDSATASAVYRNERRVHGHLLPQTIESFVGIKSASSAKYLRIVRIVVHPDFRRRGIGRKLLAAIEADARNNAIDVIGSNFGASCDLLEFWHNNDYVPVHIGLKRNASTGVHAINYLKSLTESGGTIVDNALEKFTSRFATQLTGAYNRLDHDIVDTLLKNRAGPNQLVLNEAEWEDIDSFAHSLRGYEINAPPIKNFVAHALLLPEAHKILARADKALLICKVLQQYSWQESAGALNTSGKKDAVHQLRAVLANMIQNPSIRESIILS